MTESIKSDKYLGTLDELIYMAYLTLESHEIEVAEILDGIIKNGKIKEAIKKLEDMKDGR